MAIDSAEKRRSAYGVFHVRGIPPVTPNSTKDSEWRQEALWGYAGIAAGAVTAPVFSGTIPDVRIDVGDPAFVTDLSVYFSNSPTSYSIAPAVETGWNFDTSSGILTLLTTEAGVFGDYIVTATNAGGSDVSNAFGVEVVAVPSSGGGVRRRRTQNRTSIISFSGFTDQFQIEVPPIEIEETVEGVQKEIERVDNTRELLQLQINSANEEINNLSLELEEDARLRHEMLIKDTIRAGNFITELLLQVAFLRTVKKKREEEDILVSIIMMELGKSNITIN